MARGIKLAAAVVALVSTSALAQGDRAQLAQAVAECPANAQQLAAITECRCGEAGQSAGMSVWGTDIYTDDSNICAAARHAAVIGADGGAVRVTVQPGQLYYRGSARNGVASADFAQWNRSFAVSAPGVPAAALPAGPQMCPTTAQPVREPIECTCAAGATGGVWGTDVYTDDSNICAAAQHAGVIDAGGGTIRVVVQGGQPSYRGSARNGIASADYGQWSRSFAVARAGSAPAAPQTAAAIAGLAGDWSPDSPCRSTSFRLRFTPGSFAMFDGAERTAEFEIAMTPAAGARAEMRIARVAFASPKLQPATIPQPGTVMVLDLSGGRLSIVETRLPNGAVVRPANLAGYGRCE